MHWLPPPHYFIWKIYLGPLEKKSKKRFYINRDEIFQKNSPVQPFWPQKKKETILEELKVVPVERETKMIQVVLATTCDKNE